MDPSMSAQLNINSYQVINIGILKVVQINPVYKIHPLWN